MHAFGSCVLILPPDPVFVEFDILTVRDYRLWIVTFVVHRVGFKPSLEAGWGKVLVFAFEFGEELIDEFLKPGIILRRFASFDPIFSTEVLWLSLRL